LLPHNQSSDRAVDINDAITIPESQVKSFFDIQVNRWGHARENKWRTELSFYLQSDLIGKNLKEVYQDQDSKDWRTKTGWRMTTHTLHESADQEIGFFMGKAVKFTWRDDMASRIKEHIDPLASTESLQADIPVSVRENYSKADDAEAEVVTLFVGKRDANIVIKILKENPFPI
jgi:hypothetical protein